MTENVPHTNEAVSSASPGDILKRCREFHGMTLEDAAEATKISSEHLQALEENRYTQFASLAYLKGFVRIYATSLGLNPDDLIRLYSRMYNGIAESDNAAHSSSATTKKKRKGFPFQKLLIPALLLVLILITSAIINRTSPVAPPPAPVPVQTASAPIPQLKALSSARTIPAIPDRIPAPVEKPAAPRESAVKEPVQAATEEARKGFNISLKALRNSTLTITIDNLEPQQHELTAGDRIEWRGTRKILLELFDAGAFEAQLNGKAVAPFGPDGLHKTVTVLEDGVQ